MSHSYVSDSNEENVTNDSSDKNKAEINIFDFYEFNEEIA